METTSFPEKIPAGFVSMFVMYIGTLWFSEIFLTSIPPSIRADSKEKLHPITNATRSSLQSELTSSVSATNFPLTFLQKK